MCQHVINTCVRMVQHCTTVVVTLVKDVCSSKTISIGNAKKKEDHFLEDKIAHDPFSWVMSRWVVPVAMGTGPTP